MKYIIGTLALLGLLYCTADAVTLEERVQGNYELTRKNKLQIQDNLYNITQQKQDLKNNYDEHREIKEQIKNNNTKINSNQAQINNNKSSIHHNSINIQNNAQSVSRLDNRVTALDNKVNRLDDKLEGGLATVTALTQLHPNPRFKGKTQISIGTGMYADNVAGAVGVFHHFNDRVMMNASASYGGQSQWAGGIGLSIGIGGN